jgi:putative redox protein
MKGKDMGSVTLRWIKGKMMAGTDSTGHSIVIGRSPENPDEFFGMKPSDLLLLSAASCAAYDVIEILHKQREPMRELKVIVAGEQIPEPPSTFTSIHLHYTLRGNVDPSRLEKAIRLSEDKYCSVISTLRGGVPVTSDYEILE